MSPPNQSLIYSTSSQRRPARISHGGPTSCLFHDDGVPTAHIGAIFAFKLIQWCVSPNLEYLKVVNEFKGVRKGVEHDPVYEGYEEWAFIALSLGNASWLYPPGDWTPSRYPLLPTPHSSTPDGNGFCAFRAYVIAMFRTHFPEALNRAKKLAWVWWLDDAVQLQCLWAPKLEELVNSTWTPEIVRMAILPLDPADTALLQDSPPYTPFTVPAQEKPMGQR